MNSTTITNARLYNQHLTQPSSAEPDELVRWLGAVQAQDYLGSLWGIGLRLKGSNESEIEHAIESRKIVRSWPMRGTLHFVAAEDLRWMLQFLTPRVIQRSAGLYKQVGLDDKVFSKCNKLLSAVLKGGEGLTRKEIYAVWERARISTASQRGLHILGHLAQTGLICFGARKGRQQTFVLLDEWLPSSKMLQKDQAFAKLTLAYFQSHGPATIQDFSWWSGLTIAEATQAVKSLGSQLVEEKLGTQAYYILPGSKGQKTSQLVFLLPNYDEYFVAYKDRSAAINQNLVKNIPQFGNGIFTSPIVINGLMAGNWKRSFLKDKVLIETNVIASVSKTSIDAMETAARRFGKFLKMPVEVSRNGV